MNFRLFFLGVSLLVLIMGAHMVTSHSWLSSLGVEGKDTVGYIRSYKKNDPQADKHNAYVLSNPTFKICNQNQQEAVNFPEWPRLKAAPGDRVIAWHLENGHVSFPETAGRAGRTYWFGTTKPNMEDTLGDILKWKDGGEEQDGPGIYLGAAPFDDGNCSEPNNTPISAQRGVGPTGSNKPCKDTGFVVPNGLKAGTVFTVYWLWDYSEHVPGIPELYSSCLDIDIVATCGGSPTGPPAALASAKSTTAYNEPTRANNSTEVC